MTDSNIFLALTNPAPGAEREFNEFYDQVHLRDVLNIPGFKAAQRFRLADEQRENQPQSQWRYLAIYEFDATPAQIHQSFTDYLPQMKRAPAPVWDAGHAAWVFSPIGERISNEGA